MSEADEINDRLLRFLRPHCPDGMPDSAEFLDMIPPLDTAYLRALGRFERGESGREEAEQAANALATAWVRVARRHSG